MSLLEQLLLLLLILIALFLLILGFGKKKLRKLSVGIVLLTAALIAAINLPWPLTTIIGVDPSKVISCSAFKRGGSGEVTALPEEEAALLLETLEGHSAKLITSGGSLTLPAGTFESGQYHLSFWYDPNGKDHRTVIVYGNGLLICGDRLYTLTKMPEYDILDFLTEHAITFE